MCVSTRMSLSSNSCLKLFPLPSIKGISTIFNGFTPTQVAHEYKVSSSECVFTHTKPNWNKEWFEECLSLSEFKTHTCTHISHTQMQTHAQTHSLPHCTLTPVRALHRCLHFFPSLLEIKKIFKKSLQSVSAPILSPVPPSFFPASTSSLLCSSFRPLPLRRSRTSFPDRRTFKWKLQYFPVLSCPLLLSLLTSLQCSSSQLSFPAVSLGTASRPPPSHSSLFSLTFVCLPPFL